MTNLDQNFLATTATVLSAVLVAAVLQLAPILRFLNQGRSFKGRRIYAVAVTGLYALLVLLGAIGLAGIPMTLAFGWDWLGYATDPTVLAPLTAGVTVLAAVIPALLVFSQHQQSNKAVDPQTEPEESDPREGASSAEGQAVDKPVIAVSITNASGMLEKFAVPATLVALGLIAGRWSKN